MSESLKFHPDFKDLQGYVEQAAGKSGIVIQDSTDALLLLSGQLGRLAKVIRIESGLAFHTGSEVSRVADELVGLLHSVINLANFSGIDLEEAFRSREKRLEEENGSR